MKHLGNMTKEELRLSYLQYKLMELDDMAQELGIYNDIDFESNNPSKDYATKNDGFGCALPDNVVRGDLSNPEEWHLFKRSGNNDLYPLSKALYRNIKTGEVVAGMINEQSGDKLIGEIIQDV